RDTGGNRARSSVPPRFAAKPYCPTTADAVGALRRSPTLHGVDGSAPPRSSSSQREHAQPDEARREAHAADGGHHRERARRPERHRVQRTAEQDEPGEQHVSWPDRARPDEPEQPDGENAERGDEVVLTGRRPELEFLGRQMPQPVRTEGPEQDSEPQSEAAYGK